MPVKDLRDCSSSSMMRRMKLRIDGRGEKEGSEHIRLTSTVGSISCANRRKVLHL